MIGYNLENIGRLLSTPIVNQDQTKSIQILDCKTVFITKSYSEMLDITEQLNEKRAQHMNVVPALGSEL